MEKQNLKIESLKNKKNAVPMGFIQKSASNFLPEKIRWQIRGMKGYFWAPVIFMFVLQPIYAAIILFSGYGFGNVYITDEIKSCIFRSYPVLSLWWPLRLLSKYLEEDDRELYYLGSKIKWQEIRVYYRIFMVLAAVIVLPCIKWLEPIPAILLLLGTAALCYFYNALFYFLAYLTKSATITLLPFLVYTFYVLAPYQYDTFHLSYLNLVYGVSELRSVLNCMALFLAGALLVKAGKKLNGKYCRYS